MAFKFQRIYLRIDKGTLKNVRYCCKKSEPPETGLSFIDTEKIKNPMDIFNKWQKEASEHIKPYVSAMNLATCTKTGEVSNRSMMCRGVEDDGFIIMCPCNTLKIQNIRENPEVSITFSWIYLDKDKTFIVRQVRARASTERLPRCVTDKIFDQEPLNAKLRYHISPQGQKINFKEFKTKHDELYKETKTCKKPLTSPSDLVSYKIIPHNMDFYHKEGNLLPDRVNFYKKCGIWIQERLGA